MAGMDGPREEVGGSTGHAMHSRAVSEFRRGVADILGSVTDDNEQPSPTRRAGRPRRWANDAERARAYRARRATEPANPDDAATRAATPTLL